MGPPGQGGWCAAHRLILVPLVVLTATVASGQTVRQLTDVRTGSTSLGALDDAGGSVFAVSSTDPLGTNPGRTGQVFRWDPLTGDVEQLTFFRAGMTVNDVGPSVGDDGQRIVFHSSADLTGENPDQSAELFVMQADGSGLLQLTDAPVCDAGIGFYDLSGNGLRVVFSSSADHFGTNPERRYTLYAVDTDGTGLVQLVQLPSDVYWATISDDGQRVSFDFARQIWAVDADGADLRQLTYFEYGFSGFPRISGDGSTIVFETTADVPNPDPGGCRGDRKIAAIDWDGTGLNEVAAPCQGAAYPGPAQLPDVTDDGEVVFYTAQSLPQSGGPGINWEVWRANRDGTGETQLTDADGGPGAPAECIWSRTSGSGNRVAFVCQGGEPFGRSNPDRGRELYTMTGAGTAHRQLSDGVLGQTRQPDITADGTRLALVSDLDLAGDAPGIGRQVYRMATDGTDLLRLTALGDRTPEDPAITDDGSTIVFAAGEIHLVQADGSGLGAITPPGLSRTPDISGDGSLVVFASTENFTGENPGLAEAVYRVLPDGTGLALLATGTAPRSDATGTWVAYQDGGTSQAGRIFRVRTDGSLDEPISAEPGRNPDISADGLRIVYESEGDPLGTNPDGNTEVFLWDGTTGATAQLTLTDEGVNVEPALSRDGAFVHFLSNSPFFGEGGGECSGSSGIFRIAVATGTLERVSAFVCGFSDDERPVAVDATGARAVFAGGDCAGGANPDRNLELFLIDRLAPSRIRVSPGTEPTVVSWDPESGPLRYDVVRGDVTELALAGDTVDLGAVACIENDSTDADTRGFEDATLPDPGQVLFYLYRGTPGASAGAGSYGTGSGDRERVPASGDCVG